MLCFQHEVHVPQCNSNHCSPLQQQVLKCPHMLPTFNPCEWLSHFCDFPRFQILYIIATPTPHFCFITSNLIIECLTHISSFLGSCLQFFPSTLELKKCLFFVLLQCPPNVVKILTQDCNFWSVSCQVGRTEVL